MPWQAIGAGIATTGFLGVILIAAAKSVFRTKKEAEDAAISLQKKLYDEHGVTNFITRLECEKHKNELDRRHDAAQRKTCDLLKEIKSEFKENHKETTLVQSTLSREVITLTGQFNQFAITVNSLVEELKNR